MTNTKNLQWLTGLMTEAIEQLCDMDLEKLIDMPGQIKSNELQQLGTDIKKQVRKSKDDRLNKKRGAFKATQKMRDTSLSEGQNRDADILLQEMIHVISNQQVPKNLSLGFREQASSGSDQDIQALWRKFVQLGLIPPEGLKRSE